MRPSVPSVFVAALFVACAPASDQANQASAPPASPAGLASVKDNASQRDVVKVAAASKDHTTLVTAVTAAGLTDVLASSGPYTVFAPTNAAFDRLPKGTVEDLLKPANRDKLEAILRHHVTTSVYQLDELKDGMQLSMADGSPVTITKKGTDAFFGGAKIVGTARATNGIVHVIDGVVVPGNK